MFYYRKDAINFFGGKSKIFSISGNNTWAV